MSITLPLGFRAAGVTAGLKISGDPDVAVVLNDGPSYAAAAVFTLNRVKAAPVRWTEQVARRGQVRAVVLNSGGANACTGPAGDDDTRLTAERLADAISCPAAEIAVCSTGLIGERLAMELLLPAVDKAAAAADSGGGGTAAFLLLGPGDLIAQLTTEIALVQLLGAEHRQDSRQGNGVQIVAEAGRAADPDHRAARSDRLGQGGQCLRQVKAAGQLTRAWQRRVE